MSDTISRDTLSSKAPNTTPSSVNTELSAAQLHKARDDDVTMVINDIPSFSRGDTASIASSRRSSISSSDFDQNIENATKLLELTERVRSLADGGKDDDAVLSWWEKAVEGTKMINDVATMGRNVVAGLALASACYQAVSAASG